MRTTSIATTLATLLLLMAASASATDYYVSTSGSDGNSGSAGSPWRTLQHAANSVTAGDVVHVSDGTYVGFQIRTSGTSSNPITFVADGTNVQLNQRNQALLLRRNQSQLKNQLQIHQQNHQRQLIHLNLSQSLSLNQSRLQPQRHQHQSQNQCQRSLRNL